MRKVLAFLSASLCLTLATAAQSQQVADMFKDVPSDHWAYQAVENLRQKGIVIGYPDGSFRGKRTLTRYEFAVALDRALGGLETRIRALEMRPREGPGTPQPGPAGPAGPQGPAGPPGVAPEELAQLRRLTDEFRNELAALGNNMRAVQARLDQLAREIAAIRDELAKMPKFNGNAFLGVRGDIFNGNYVDKDGRVNPLGMEQQAVVHAFRLGVDANVAGGASVSAGLTTGNYKNYLGGNIAKITPRPQGLNFPGITIPHNSNSLSSAVQGDTYLDTLEIRAPFTGIGRGSNLTVGRIPARLGRLVLWRPDVDTYFNVPWLDDGNYRIDGARLSTNFGSVNVEAFGGQFKSVMGANGQAWNSPLAGTALDPLGTRIFEFDAKPTGQPTLGQMIVDEVIGVSAGIGIRQFGGGHVRFSVLDTEGRHTEGGFTPFTGVHVLGADMELRLSDRLNLTGDWGKTIAHTGRDNPMPGATHFNNAFNAALGFGIGALNISAGYRYIDPNFYAPGYWGRIGNWINPTNVQGPTARVNWDMGSLALNFGADFFQAARDRGAEGGMNSDDQIVRALFGIRWNLSKSFQISADWEGVYWTLEGAHSEAGPTPSLTTGPGFLVHPTEHYITLGTGYNLTSNTMLRLLWQTGAFDGHGALMNAPGLGPRNTFNVVTGAVAVRF
jgi:hypothetical protein